MNSLLNDLKMGEDFQPQDDHANSHPSRQVVIIDNTSPGTFVKDQLRNTVWSARYAGLYFFNRSPWVEHNYVGAIADIKLLPSGAPIPYGTWVIELLDTSDQPGAIGYHEGQAYKSKTGTTGTHSERGVALHPEAGTEMVLSKVFVKTSREDGVPSTEVLTHELWEMMVDPYVNNENEIKVYTNPADGKEYIAEVGDPVQNRAWDVGAPEGRPCGVPEAMIADWAYPGWWNQEQRRPATCFCDDREEWQFGLSGFPQVGKWEVAAGGYMSVRSPGGPWETLRGAEAAPHNPQ